MAGSHEQITGLNTVKTPTLPAGCRKALVQAETQNVRYTVDGTTPSSTNGILIIAGQAPVSITVEAGLDTIKFIEATASAKLNLLYYT